jgi:hypothetical protein
MDVLIGVRSLSVDNTLTVAELGTVERSSDIVDAVLVIRKGLRLTKKLHFNSTMSFGTGDSNFTMETHPQLKYQFTRNIAGLVGFRIVSYDLEGEDDKAAFDGAFRGLTAGVNGTF